MKGTILEKILDAKRIRVEAAKRKNDVAALIERGRSMRADSARHRFRDALSTSSRINIIAEIKRASPSKGIINEDFAVADLAKAYEEGGAAAISVLTEEDFFKGSLDDLREVRESVALPVLRKDFIFDEFQIYEAAEAGADAILLIVAMLPDDVLKRLFDLAENELGMDALVEVHTIEKLRRAVTIGANMIGVNNRDLNTFDVSLDVSRELIQHASTSLVMVAESGLRTREDLIELRELGYSGFLIGETLMRSGDPEKEIRNLATDAHR
ncbi:MAG: indole-3-glycerol phosphate synthase TrpC [Pyrinomonadaceae bacterium]